MLNKIKTKIYSGSKKYSSLFGLDLTYFIKGGFWLFLSQGFTILKSLIISYIFANFTTKQIYGQYNFIITIMSTALMFSLQGMAPVIVQTISEKKFGTYFEILKKILKWSILGCLFLSSVAIYGIYIKNSNGVIIFLLLALLFPFFAISNFYTKFFHGLKDFKLVAKILIFFDLTFTILLTSLIFFKVPILPLILISYLYQIIYQGYFTWFHPKKYIINNEIDPQAITFGTKYSIYQIIPIFAAKIDYLFVTLFLGFEELAAYTLITAIPNQFKSLIGTGTALILPKISKKDLNKNKAKKHIIKWITLSLIVIASYYFIAPFIFKIFYPKYYEYHILSIIFNISFIGTLFTLFNIYFIHDKQEKILKKINIISSLFLIIISFLLTKNFGIIGAITARICFRIFSALIAWKEFNKLY